MLLSFELLTGMWLSFWDKAFHWNLGLADQAGLADLWASCLCPCAPAVVTNRATYSFLCGCWGPNAASHACVASTLPALSFCFPCLCWLCHYYSIPSSLYVMGLGLATYWISWLVCLFVFCNYSQNPILLTDFFSTIPIAKWQHKSTKKTKA